METLQLIKVLRKHSNNWDEKILLQSTVTCTAIPVMVSAGVLVENTLYRGIPLFSQQDHRVASSSLGTAAFFSTITPLINCLVFLLCFVVSIIVLKIVLAANFAYFPPCTLSSS